MDYILEIRSNHCLPFHLERNAVPYKINDIVRLAVDLPREGLVAGAIGVVADEFTEPTQAFESEFANDKGECIAQLALTPEQISRPFNT